MGEGLLISFDGTDSSGKETQARLLTAKLQEIGRVVGKFETPDYSLESGKKLKALFQGKAGSWDELGWREQMELLAANRAEHRDEVLEILKKGGVVVYDRYVPSSMAHMTVDALPEEEVEKKRQRVIDEVAKHEYEVMGMPRGNLSIWLDVPPKIALELLEERKQALADLDEATDDLHLQERIYAEYLWLARNNPEYVVQIKCTKGDKLRSIDVIAEDVWKNVLARFPQLSDK